MGDVPGPGQGWHMGECLAELSLWLAQGSDKGIVCNESELGSASPCEVSLQGDRNKGSVRQLNGV